MYHVLISEKSPIEECFNPCSFIASKNDLDFIFDSCFLGILNTKKRRKFWKDFDSFLKVSFYGFCYCKVVGINKGRNFLDIEVFTRLNPDSEISKSYFRFKLISKFPKI